MTAWMETFCIRCSVRLGVIIVSIISMITSIIPPLYINLVGNDILQRNFFDPIEASSELKEHIILRLVVRTFDKDANKMALFLTVGFLMQALFCVLAIIGAIRLNKWLLVPFIILGFLMFVSALTLHVVLMVVLKKKLNLGFLIAATITGGFILLLSGYMWVTVVAFFQIIQLVETDKYKALYGEDPLATWDTDDYLNESVENVRMYKTPNFDQITPLKGEKLPTKKQLKEKSVATIQINEPNIQLAVQEFRNWHAKELAVVRKSNLLKFS